MVISKRCHVRKKNVLWSVAAVLILGVASVQATAGTEQRFEISEQPLGEALKAYAAQMNVQLMFAEEDVANLVTQGVSGTFSREAALQQLLQNSGLVFEFAGDNVVVVKQGEAPVQQAADTMESARQSDAKPRQRERVIEEVIVTAQKREQSLKDVPMSIVALGSEEIGKKGIKGLQDLSFYVPGVVARQNGPGNIVLFMRGVGNDAGNESLTSAYLDEAPLNLGVIGNNVGGSGSRLFPIRAIDIERVEILQGPQGTLYGAGAVSGTVRFVSRNPELDHFGAGGDVSVSFTKNGAPSQELTAILNVPVVEDKFGVRIASTIANLGGWIDYPAVEDEDVNNQELAHIRAKALWKPTDAFSVTALVNIHRNDSEMGTFISDEERNFSAGTLEERKIPFDENAELYNLTMNYDAGFSQIVSATSYITRDSRETTSLTGSDSSFLDGIAYQQDANYKKDVFTQELRLSSSNDSSLNWILGGFYRDQSTDFDQTLYFTFFDTEQIFNEVSLRSSESYAIFGDLSFEVIDGLEIGGGLRKFWDKQQFESNFFAGFEGKEDFEALTWRAYASYDLTENIKTYFNVGTGFRSGGFNPAVLFELPPYDSETLTSYEVGAKGSLFNNRLSADVAIFFSEYDDMVQQSSVIIELPDGSFLPNLLYDNVGSAEVIGLDANITWHVTEQLTINANGTLSDGEIKEIDKTVPNGPMVGDDLDYVPDYTYSIGAEYAFNWVDEIPGFLRLDYNHRSRTSLVARSTVPSGIMYSDEIDFVNARLGLEWNQWALELFVDNLTDEYPSLDPGRDLGYLFRPRPRTVGIKVGINLK